MSTSPEAATLQELGISISQNALGYYVAAVRRMRTKNEESMSGLQRKLDQDCKQRELELAESCEHAMAQLQEEHNTDLYIAKGQHSKIIWRADEAALTERVST